MRNLVLALLFTILFIGIAVAQSKKIEGYPGAPGNYITGFKGDNFVVQRNDGYAIINLDGTVMVSGIKTPAVGFSRKLLLYHGIFFAGEAGNIVLKDIKGKTLGPGKYKEIIPFVTDNTVARVPSEPGVWIVAYIDTTGKEVVRFDVRKYMAIVDPPSKTGGLTFVSLSEFLPFSEGLTPIRSRVAEKFGFIDKKLRLVIPVSFKKASPFSEGLAAVQNDDDNWRFINTTGKLVIPYSYSRRPSRFMAGLARVENKEGRFGFINKENQVVISPQYEFATCFYKGYALVRQSYNHPVLLIDSSATVVASFPKDISYIDNARPPIGIFGNEEKEYPFYVSETLQQLIDEGKGIFKKGGNYGLVDNKGKIVLDFRYQYLSDFHNDKMFAHKSEFINNSTRHEYGIINENGELVVEIVNSGF